MTKFTRNRKEILKYLNAEIKYHKEIEADTKSLELQYKYEFAANVLMAAKKFMTEKTDWI